MTRFGETQPHPEWRIAVEWFTLLDYGQVVRHADLAEAMGLDPQTPVYYRHTSQAKRATLRDHGISVVCIPKVGYKRLEPECHGKEARRNVRLGTKRIKLGGKVISVAPLDKLTPEQSRELEHSMVLVRALHTQMSTLYRSMKSVLPPVSAKVRQLAEATAENTNPDTVKH